jgi:uncharacterized protein DUF5615
MTIYLDDDSASRQLSLVLRKAGHQVSTPADLVTSGAPDPVHLTRAIRDGRVFLTRNARDFTLLHDLVRASGGGHPGILLLHFDNDPTGAGTEGPPTFWPPGTVGGRFHPLFHKSLSRPVSRGPSSNS